MLDYFTSPTNPKAEYKLSNLLQNKHCTFKILVFFKMGNSCCVEQGDSGNGPVRIYIIKQLIIQFKKTL